MFKLLSHSIYTADINCDDEEFYCPFYDGDPNSRQIYVDNLDGGLLRTIPVGIDAYWVDYDPIRRCLFVATQPAPGLIQQLALDGTVLDTYDLSDQGAITVYGLATNTPEPVTIALVSLGGAGILLRRRGAPRKRGVARNLLPMLLVVLCAPGLVQASITITVKPSGSYTVSVGGTSTLVDTYTLTYDAGQYTLGALIVDVGLPAGKGGSNPFQGAWIALVPPKNVYKTFLTPTKDDADMWLDPSDATHVNVADSHFLPPGIGTWPVAVLVPYEANDKSIYNPGNVNGDYVLGTGPLSVAVAVPNERKTRVMEVLRVGVIRGHPVWVHDQSADDMGHSVVHQYILIPEPGTLALLGAGAWLWFGKKRRSDAS